MGVTITPRPYWTLLAERLGDGAQAPHCISETEYPQLSLHGKRSFGGRPSALKEDVKHSQSRGDLLRYLRAKKSKRH